MPQDRLPQEAGIGLEIHRPIRQAPVSAHDEGIAAGYKAEGSISTVTGMRWRQHSNPVERRGAV